MATCETKPQVVIDFLSDWAELQRGELVKLGIKTSAGASAQDVSFAYWNVRRRFVEAHPRAVLLADTFSCPASVEPGLRRLRDRFDRGDDVNLCQSTALRSVDHPTFDDRLLNDWGIHHFHLGEVSPSNPTGRSKELLFSVVKETAVYFIGVGVHEANAWTNVELIEVIHRNWPELIRRWKCDCWDADLLSKDDMRKLRGRGGKKRKTGFTFPVTLSDGTVYVSPGGGNMANGLSAQVLETSDHYFTCFHDIQKYVEGEVERILGAIRTQGRTPATPPHFQMMLDDALNVYVVERTAEICIKVGSLVDPGASSWIYRLWYAGEAPRPQTIF